MNTIKTLNQLADYINSENYNQLTVNSIIEANGWEDLSGNNDYDVCAFNGQKVTLDQNTGEASVVDDKYSERVSLRDIADEYDLQFVETTDQINGYPSNIMGAIIGMDSFELAEELAVKYNLDIEVIEKRDGWQFWYRTGNWATEPLNITEDDFGDDYFFLRSEEGFYENEVKPFLDDFNSIDDLMEFLEEKKEIEEALSTAGDEYVVVTYQGRYYDTINTRPMEFSYDTKNWAIALINRQ